MAKVFSADPGVKSGAMLIREAGRVLDWWAWCPVTRDKREQYAVLMGSTVRLVSEVSALHLMLYSELNLALSEHSGIASVVEQPMSAGKFISTGAFTAQGMVLGVCAAHGIFPKTPLSTSWRAQVGIPGGVTAAEAEKIALEICLERTSEDISKVLKEISGYGAARKALAEAWLIAEFVPKEG